MLFTGILLVNAVVDLNDRLCLLVIDNEFDFCAAVCCGLWVFGQAAAGTIPPEQSQQKLQTGICAAALRLRVFVRLSTMTF